MQQDELIITREDQAKALQEVGFLGCFLEPASPSEVAKELDMPANLAHHHAKRHAALGLLNEVSREGGKVYYQLAARTFKHDRKLLPDDPDHMSANLTRLQQRFLSAYERSDRLAGEQDPDWTIYGFSGEPPPRVRNYVPSEPHPAHFEAHTFRLSAEAYHALVRQIAHLLETAEPSGEKPCTLAFLAFDGVLQDGTQDHHTILSFAPPIETSEADH